MIKKEIGGYFAFGDLVDKEYYNNCLRFNSARNSLRYLIEKRGIKKIYLPYYLCDSMDDVCKKTEVIVKHYHISKEFLPIIEDEILDDEYVCIVNYYGILGDDIILSLKEKYHRIVVDNTHAFFSKPIDGIDTIYSCRKFFGVPDGSYLSTDLKMDDHIVKGKSFFRAKHLFGRLEYSASDFFNEYRKAEMSFDDDIAEMSDMTRCIMGALDYGRIEKKRRENISFMHSCLGERNELDFKIENMCFMYPFLCNNSESLREELIKNRVYVPVLWPNVLESKENIFEYRLAKDIIPIPIDQRYDLHDMKYIYDIIRRVYE